MLISKTLKMAPTRYVAAADDESGTMKNDKLIHRPAILAAVAFALVLAAPASLPAQAGERADLPYEVADSNNLPTRVPGLGTFSGGISARKFKGNGIYFSIDGNDRCCGGAAASKPSKPRPSAKIIDMQDAEDAMDCDNPGDVCIIRP